MGSVITNKGMALMTKLVAAEADLDVTRAAVGTGILLSGYDPHSMTDLIAYKMDGTISAHSRYPEQSDKAYIAMQVSSKGVETTFAITEAGVYANDPDEGEILYSYMDFSSTPILITSEGEDEIRFADITLEIIVGDIKNIRVYISPNALVRREEFDTAMAGKTNIVVIPEDEDIPVAERTANTWYLKVTDRQTAIGSDVIKVSPNMGIKIL